jgi:fumarate hydratase class II
VDKVNPVIPEAVLMAAARVIGNDASIGVAAQSGNFQLNTMLPLAASDLLGSSKLISRASNVLANKAIATMTVLVDNLERPLLKNPVLVTSLTPYIGYMKAAEIAKTARQEGLPVIEIARRETDIDDDLLEKLLDPRHLADGGKD